MGDRVWGNEYRLTTVCIDSYNDKVPVGRLYNPHLSNGENFRSLVELLMCAESLFEEMKLPQASTICRTFSPMPTDRKISSAAETPKKGTLATFRIRVIFRQHASWQGSVQWVEEGLEENFRSVLELIVLMDSALTKGGEERSSEESSA